MVGIYLQYHQVNYGDDINKCPKGWIGPRGGQGTAKTHCGFGGKYKLEGALWLHDDDEYACHPGNMVVSYDVGSSIQDSDVG